MMMRYALAALLLLSAPFAHGAPPSDAQVDRLLTVMRAQKTVEAIVPQVQASQQHMVRQMMAGRTLTDAQQRQLDTIIFKSNAQMLSMLSWNRMQPLYRDIYRQTFNAEDMEAMIDFYGSPAGQNLLDKMPQLMQNTMAAMQTLMAPMLQQMQKDIEAANVAATEDAAAVTKTSPAGAE